MISTEHYFDWAATSPCDEQILRAALEESIEHWGNPSSIHEAGVDAKKALEKYRKTAWQYGEVFVMAQVLVNFRLDEEDKKGMEEVCRDLGMSMSTAFTIFAKKMRREKRIPFEVSVDPFYSDANMAYLRRVMAEIDSGKAALAEHDLIED